MIFQRLGLIHKNQRGFTLIELIVAVAIIGLIGVGITTAIFQVFNVNTNNVDHMVSIKQVQNAGYWISRDTKMTQDISTYDDAGTIETEVITLAWIGWERYDEQDNQCIDSYKVRYTYDSNELWRHQTITTKKYNSSGQLVETTESSSSTRVAEHITGILISPYPPAVGNKLNVTITASVGEVVKERTYEITPRPSQA